MKNKVGIYYAYWTEEWDVDFHPYVDKVSKLGFDILEINAGTVAEMSKNELLALKQHADDEGITLTHCIGMPTNKNIASEDSSVRKAGIDFLRKMADAVGVIGGGLISGILQEAWPLVLPEGEIDKPAYLARSIQSMREVTKAAEDNQVIFNLEVVNRFEAMLLNTATEAIEYVEEVGSPNVKILLDTFHMNIEESFIGDAIIRTGSYLGHLHIGENNRLPPGYGHIPWTEIGFALRKIGYEGAVVMEPFVHTGGQVGRDIKVFRDLSVGLDIDEEARKACEFIRGVLK